VTELFATERRRGIAVKMMRKGRVNGPTRGRKVEMTVVAPRINREKKIPAEQEVQAHNTSGRMGDMITVEVIVKTEMEIRERRTEALRESVRIVGMKDLETSKKARTKSDSTAKPKGGDMTVDRLKVIIDVVVTRATMPSAERTDREKAIEIKALDEEKTAEKKEKTAVKKIMKVAARVTISVRIAVVALGVSKTDELSTTVNPRRNGARPLAQVTEARRGHEPKHLKT